MSCRNAPGFCAGNWRSSFECVLNSTVPRRSGSTEHELTRTIPLHSEVAAGQNIHADQSVELERICQLDPDDLLENKWKGGFIIDPQSQSECIAFNLPFPLRGLEGPLA